MRVCSHALLLLLLAWPHQSYAQTSTPQSDSNAVSAWFQAMGGDLVYTLQAPTRWSPRDGLKMATLAVTVGGLVHLADRDINREFSKGEDHLLLSPARGLLPLGERYDAIPSTYKIVGLTTAFVLSGVLVHEPEHVETARLLVEAYVIVNGVGVIGKRMLGRARPYVGDGPQGFELARFSNHTDFQSMPSGHSLEAFATMTVLAKRYPHWWVQLPAYSVAAGVAAQRIDARKHWVSDVVLGGTIGYQVARMLVDHAASKSDDPPSAVRVVCAPNGIGLAVTF